MYDVSFFCPRQITIEDYGALWDDEEKISTPIGGDSTTNSSAKRHPRTVISLLFSRPFHPSVRVTTSFEKKFVEVTISADCDRVTSFEFKRPSLNPSSPIQGLELEPLGEGDSILVRDASFW